MWAGPGSPALCSSRRRQSPQFSRPGWGIWAAGWGAWGAAHVLRAPSCPCWEEALGIRPHVPTQGGEERGALSEGVSSLGFSFSFQPCCDH